MTTRVCLIDDCGVQARAGRPLCDHHWDLLPAGLQDSIAEAGRLRLPLSHRHYTTFAVAYAKARTAPRHPTADLTLEGRSSAV